MPKKKGALKEEAEKKSSEDLEKFVTFFEHQNSKDSAKKLLWFGVGSITVGLVVFFAYTTQLQINAFNWDKATLDIKNTAEQKWTESFEKQEKERDISDIKKQVSGFLQQIVSTTTGTPTINTNTIGLMITSTLNIVSSTTSSINNN